MRQATDQHTIMDGAAAIEVLLGLGNLLQAAIGDLVKTIRPSSPKAAIPF
jgi:hypothetical protein